MRFSEFNDEWRKHTLNSFTERIRRKNINNKSNRPLTISARYGLIDQNDFFDRQIASKDMSGYYLLNIGEFAYNKSYSNEYPLGAVKRLDKYKNGTLSCLYICFTPKTNMINSDFLVHYFETSKWHKGILDIAGEGARNHGLLNMSVEDYFNTQHYIPYLKEQEKISTFLNLIIKRIETQSKIIEQTNSQIKSISHIMCNINNDTVKLKEVCVFENKTNHQSGEGLLSGKYIYFTNKEETTKYFNSYDFDGEYIIANTGGKANFKYYNGKFATMSDCLVIKCLKNTKTKFILYSLLNCIEKINHVGFVGSGLKHLDKDWLENMLIPKHSSIHNKYLKLIDTLALKLESEELLLKKLKEQKKYLLSNMFI